MKLAVIGTGYVGLVTGTCFAETGNEVTCIDTDARKIQVLNEGGIPIYEPGLDKIVARHRGSGRLRFTTNLGEGIDGAQAIFLAVGTPQAPDGKADMKYINAAVAQLAAAIRHPTIVIIKSTVPVGTNRRISDYFSRHCQHQVTVASNPEFLREGCAVEDCLKPDRVVIGTRADQGRETLRRLYAPYTGENRPLVEMTPESAELTKYTANAFLAMKISFINEIANLCEKVGARIDDVVRGIRDDKRIGKEFLRAGVGFGGSCFPKDISSLLYISSRACSPMRILDAVAEVNRDQKQVLGAKVRAHYGLSLRSKTLAVWGLTFKPDTDDIRDAPSMTLIDFLLDEGVTLNVHDPQGIPHIEQLYGSRLHYCVHQDEAIHGADGLIIVTEWSDYRKTTLPVIKERLREAVVFDGRNIFTPEQAREAGVVYYSIGREFPSV